MKTVVLIGGGSGTFTLLQGLRQFPTNNIVIVSTADDGGSTGKLRKELGVMPWGDVRQCLIGLSYTVPALKDLFNYRFDRGALKGHAAGNLMLAALELSLGGSDRAIAEAARMLNVRGEVLFASKTPTTLSARLKNGTVLKSEHDIDEPKTKKRSPIAKLVLSPARMWKSSIRSGKRMQANERAIDAISRADAIILGPGDLYTSTLPNLLVPGIAEAIRKATAQKILVSNIMTKAGQTEGFRASDFLSVCNAYLGEEAIDTLLVNTEKPKADLLSRYRKTGSVFVEPNAKKLAAAGVRVIEKPLLARKLYKKQNGDVLVRSFLRHDSEKTAKIIWELIK